LRILTQIDDPVLAAFPIEDTKLSAAVLYRIYCQVRNLLNPQTASEHQHEHGPIPGIADFFKERRNLFISEMLGQWSGHTQSEVLPNRVGKRDVLLLNQILVKGMDTAQMTVDGLWFFSPSQQVIHIRVGFLRGHLLQSTL